IKGLNVMKAITHALKQIFAAGGDIKQKGTETSLVEQFLFPKLGTGHMWEKVAGKVKDKGGTILTHQNVTKINVEGNRVVSVDCVDEVTGEKKTHTGDVFFSTMPMKELVRALSCEVPAAVKEVSEGLVYRDFVQVGVLVNKMLVTEDDGA